MELVGQGPERLLEQSKLIDSHAQLTTLGGHDHARRTDPIPEVQLREEASHLLSRSLLVYEQLNRAARIEKGSELKLAERAMKHQPTSHRDPVRGLARRLEVDVVLL